MLNFCWKVFSLPRSCERECQKNFDLWFFHRTTSPGPIMLQETGAADPVGSGSGRFQSFSAGSGAGPRLYGTDSESFHRIRVPDPDYTLAL